MKSKQTLNQLNWPLYCNLNLTQFLNVIIKGIIDTAMQFDFIINLWKILISPMYSTIWSIANTLLNFITMVVLYKIIDVTYYIVGPNTYKK